MVHARRGDSAALDAAELRLAVTRIARLLRRHAVTDVSPSMQSALSTIERSGALTLGELAAQERVRPPSMTRIVSNLEQRRLVTRETDELDRRVVRVDLTPAGERFLRRSRTRKDAYLARLVARLPAAEREALRASLPALQRLADGEP